MANNIPTIASVFVSRTALILFLTTAMVSVASGQTTLTASRVSENIFQISGAVDEIGVLVGKDGVLLVDGGYMETFPAVDSVLKTLSPVPPRILINTHWHHAFANPAFGANTVIIAHENVGKRLRQANLMFRREIPPQPPSGWPLVTFSDSLSLFFNGERISLHYLPRAHTDGDIVVVFHGSNVVMTGDVFVPHAPWTDYPSGGDFLQTIRAVERLLVLVPKSAKIIPGHGHLCSYQDLQEFKMLLTENLEHVRALKASGKTLEQIQAEGVPQKWKNWITDVPESLFLESIYKAVQ